MEREVLKQKLTELAETEKTSAPIEDLLFSMLPYIGDLDPILRDRLIYGLASKWITQGLVSPITMNQILDELLTGRYLYKEEKFTRSFTTLWIAAILYRHRMEAFLSAAVIERVFQALLTYIQQETVGEGYDETYGWVHTLAHAADALDELIQLAELTNDQRQTVAEEIINKMAFPYNALSHEEDERMAFVIHSALRNGLPPDIVGCMVKEKASEVIAFWPEVTEADLYIRANYKQIIRSLYFRLSDFPSLKKTLHGCEQLFSGIYHKKPSS
ncbi:hypothetical protein CHH58_08965 [Terribacillus saccharophilus]|uniref:DUF2785 domain-containing protein n=1 Tax=Terribacillus saccharophilus TaxID=361277 RepID=UPI000BA77D50|nr:DUF2785 domain-containing protein [Terribacillus saccharophilus]PAF36968.1 hypothetical protein CHH58_08965 [Terribacillus saccharophilus]